jgi:hypothetical protein
MVSVSVLIILKPRSINYHALPSTLIDFKLVQILIRVFASRAVIAEFILEDGFPSKGPHRPDAIRQRDANFQFSKTNKTVNG